MNSNTFRKKGWGIPLILASLLGQTALVQAESTLLDIEASLSKVSPPKAGDLLNVTHHLTFVNDSDTSPLEQIEVTIKDPKKNKTIDTFQISVSELDLDGSVDIIQVFDKSSLLGDYQYSFQLIDDKGNRSDPMAISLRLDPESPVPLSLTEVYPENGIPGDVIVVKGTGLEIGEDNVSIFFGMQPAAVLGAVDGGVEVQVPLGAVSGPITAVTADGRVSSQTDFEVQASVIVGGSNGLSLSVGEQKALQVYTTGLDSSDVVWRVNGVEGGDDTLGFISPDGTYTAPDVIPNGGQFEQVVVTATSTEDKTLSGQVTLVLSPPKPLRAPDTLSANLGGLIQSLDGFLSLGADPYAMDGDLEVVDLSHTYFRGDEDLDFESINGYPLMSIAFLLKESAEDVGGEYTLNAQLPMAMTPGTELMVMQNSGDGYFDEGLTMHVGDNGIDGTIAFNGTIKDMDLIIIHSDPSDGPTLQLVEANLGPIPEGIEEGMLLPVLIEGTGFYPESTRVIIDDPSLAQHFQIFGVKVAANGKSLGFTLKINTIAGLERGDTLPLAFQVQRIRSDGSVFASDATDPNDFIVEGLPELHVSAHNTASQIYTIDGQRLDAVIDGSDDRYSSIVVNNGARLGIGRTVTTVTRGGQTYDLTCLEDFEAQFGVLNWVPTVLRQGSCTTQIQIFSPDNRLVHLDVTGLVSIDGEIYLSGMRGGENSDPLNATGHQWMGGLAGDTISGGFGGDGGPTAGGITPIDGLAAGNSLTSTLGLGFTGANGGTSGGPSSQQSVAKGGTHFSDNIISHEAYIRYPVSVNSGLHPLNMGATSTTVATLGQEIEALGLEIAGLQTTAQVPNSNSVFTGHGGDGGNFGSSHASLVENTGYGLYITPGSGGGGGGGGGASIHQESILDIPFNSDEEVGGGGAGGGGAAGALRITSGGQFWVGPFAKIRASGGRGGRGEISTFLGSPGGGGGGGAGGLLKLQGAQLHVAGNLNVSGGNRSAGEIINGTIDLDRTPFRPRIQVLGGRAHGGLMTFTWARSPGQVTNATNLLWPTGRLHGPGARTMPLPGITGLYGIGMAYDFPYLGSHTVDGLLVIDSRRNIRLMTVPDYSGQGVSVRDFGVIVDLKSISAFYNFIPMDVAQSAAQPDILYVAGVLGSNIVINSVRRDGLFMGQVASYAAHHGGGQVTVNAIKDMDSLRDGRLVILMNTLADGPGVFILDPATRTTQQLINTDKDSMSVLRGENEDVIYVARHDVYFDCENGLPAPNFHRITKYDVTGNRLNSAAVVHESISEPGDPGLIRLDGLVPGYGRPQVNYDFEPVENNIFDGNPLIFQVPAMASLGSHTRLPAIQSLVFSDRDLDTLGLGAASSITANLWHEKPGGVISATMSTANNDGSLLDTVTLEEGFNQIWFEQNQAGVPPELLKRRVLLIEGAN